MSCSGDQAQSAGSRASLLGRAIRLEYVTVGWNVLEGVIAIAAALAAGSTALLGFGLDSFVESASGSILLWRLFRERRGSSAAEVEALEHRALRLVAVTLFALAAYVAFDSVQALQAGERPDPSPVGMVLVSVSLVLMWWLARAKAASARALWSRALAADSFQTLACWWLSLVTLAGLGLNAALGWWWADPLAALGIVVLILREAREAWRGETCCG